MSESFLEELAAQEASAAARAEAGNGSDRYLPTPKGTGAVEFWILPPLPGGKLLVSSHKHFVGETVLTCRADHSGRFPVAGVCPFCDEAANIFRARKRADMGGNGAEVARLTELVKPYKSAERHYLNCWTPEHGVRVFSCGKTVRDLIVTGILGDKSIGEKGYGDVTEPAKARPFKLIKDVSDGYPKYHKSKYLDVSPLPPKEVEAILAARFDLGVELVLSSAEDVAAAFSLLKNGGASEAPATAIDQSEFERLLKVM